MLVNSEDINKLAREFEASRQILSALGDESRQHLILEMMRMKECNGVCGGRNHKKDKSLPPLLYHIIFGSSKKPAF